MLFRSVEFCKKNNNCVIQLLKTILNSIENVLFPLDKDAPNILMIDYIFKRIIKQQEKNYNFFIICNSIHQMKKEYRYRENFRNHFPHKWETLINKSFFSKNMYCAHKAIELIKQYITKNNIRIVIIGNDKLFLEKAVIFAARECKVPVVIMQHGVYNKDSFEKLHSAYTCDYFWAWSDYTKDIYLDVYNKENNSVKVIGYPFEIVRGRPQKKRTVLFLGNYYANVNKIEGERYLNIAKMVYDICIKKEYIFTYRPHPSEIIDDSYGILLKSIRKGVPLAEDLKYNEIVIGDISSVMLEAGLIGRKVIQIIWSDRSKIGFTDPIYSFTLKCSDNYQDIEQLLDNVFNKDDEAFIDDYYLKVNDNFETTIFNLINELLN